MNHFSASQPICEKRVRERIQRVGFDVSTNLSEREGKREREREEKRGRERSVGAMCEFWFSREL